MVAAMGDLTTHCTDTWIGLDLQALERSEIYITLCCMDSSKFEQMSTPIHKFQ